MPNYVLKYAWGHWEVYKNGEFYCSTDTKAEAMKEIEEED